MKPLVIILSSLFLLSGCVTSSYTHTDIPEERHWPWPYVSIQYFENGEKEYKGFSLGIGKGKTVSTTAYYPNGQKKSEGRINHHRSKDGHLRLSWRQGKWNYYSEHGELLWTQISKRDTIINKVPRHIIRKMNSIDETMRIGLQGVLDYNPEK